MVRVRVEFWMWSGEALGPDFESPTSTRTTLTVSAEDGTTVRALFEALERYPLVKSQVFSHRHFQPEINLALNSLVMGHDELYDRILTDGDQLSVFPAYAGG